MESKKNAHSLGHVFHVDLSDCFEGEDYWLHTPGCKTTLVRHTEETLATAFEQQPELTKISKKRLTHFTREPVKRPLGSVTRISVRHTNKTGKISGDYGIHHAAIHIVPNDEKHQLLASTGKIKVESKHIDYVSTAQSLLFHHADLITTDPTNAAIVMEHMQQDTAYDTYMLIEKLANNMRAAGPPTDTTGWATYQDYDAGASGIKKTLVPTSNTINFAGDSMTAVQVSTKNDTRLQGSSWTVEEGTSVVTQGDSSHQLMASLVTGEEDNWKASLSNTSTANGLLSSITILNGTTNQVTIKMVNSYVRWLGAYIQFIDADGNPMKTPTWQPDDGGNIQKIVSALDLNYDDIRFIGWISPINTVMGVPFGPNGELKVNVTFPTGAVSANLYGCGLGTGNNQYPKTPVIGGVFTGLANLAIPTFFLGLGVAAQTWKPLYDLMGEKEFIIAVVSLGVVYFGADFTYQGAVNKKMDWSAFSCLTQILFTQGANKALIWCEKQIVEGEIEDEIPFAGWIMLAINIATTLAQMAETIVEVASSPWLIPNSISTTITSKLVINPDPRHGAFPAPPSGSKASYVTKMIYKNENRPGVISTNPLDPDNYPTALTSEFTNTLGGKVKFEVNFYLDNWLAGKANTEWLENNEETTANIPLYLFQLPIPLTSESVYKHTAILSFKNNAYTWIQQSACPTATISDRNTSQSGNAISDWTGLALSQRSTMLGISFKAAGSGLVDCSSGAGGQLYAFENIDIPGATMDSVKFPSCGLSSPSQLVYDVFPAKFLMKDGNFVVDADGKPEPDPSDKSLGNYYIDPRKATNDQDVDGGYHLRNVVLDSTTAFNMAADQNSYGRFPYYPDSISMHPSGHIIGVNRKYYKMMITSLAGTNGLADKDVPLAITFAGQALNYNSSGGRAGLLFTPVAVTCSSDGTILVLEQLRSNSFNIARIQAFDLNGNPVNCFKGSDGNPSPFLTLDSNITYLDVVAVGDSYSTYLYVLYYANSGQAVSDYSMSIYQYGKDAPAGNLLVTTPNVPAARINVDMWHTMYTLNYAMTQDGAGNNAGPTGGKEPGLGGRTVPSVSEWVPPLT